MPAARVQASLTAAGAQRALLVPQRDLSVFVDPFGNFCTPQTLAVGPTLVEICRRSSREELGSPAIWAVKQREKCRSDHGELMAINSMLRH